jgi:hypothetical protein
MVKVGYVDLLKVVMKSNKRMAGERRRLLDKSTVVNYCHWPNTSTLPGPRTHHVYLLNLKSRTPKLREIV